MLWTSLGYYKLTTGLTKDKVLKQNHCFQKIYSWKAYYGTKPSNDSFTMHNYTSHFSQSEEGVSNVFSASNFIRWNILYLIVLRLTNYFLNDK